MGNLLACFGGQEKNGSRSSSSRRKAPPGKRRSLPSQPQQQQQLVLGHHEASLETSEPLLRKQAPPELKTPDGDAGNGHLLNSVGENVLKLARTCDDEAAPSLDVLPKQPSLGSPSSTQVAPSSSPRKKVTFDLNVQAYEHVPAEDEEEIENADQEEKKAAAQGTVKEKDQGCAKGKKRDLEFPGNNNRYGNCADSDEDDDGLFCDIDEDNGDEGCEDSDMEGDDDAVTGTHEEEEESFDSYFSLQMDKNRPDSKSSAKEAADADDADSELTPVALKRAAARDRSKYINSVLNPVENIAQWKDVKAGRKSSAQVKSLPLRDKENISHSVVPEIPSSPEPKLHPRSPKWAAATTTKNTAPASAASPKHEVSVDTSLSSWLTPSRTATATAPAPTIKAAASSNCTDSSFSQQTSYWSNNTTNSFTSLEERPILGALTVDDIKRSSKSPSVSPRKSPSRSPDETPIVGTVGSYWKHTEQEVDSRFARSSPSDVSEKGIPNSTSKYRENNRVNWHSTPFEVRLERALLNKGSPASSSLEHSPIFLTPCVESS